MSVRLNMTHKRDIASKARAVSPLNKELRKLLEDRKLLAEKIRIESLGGKALTGTYEAIEKQMTELRDQLPDNLRSHLIGIYRASDIRVRTSTEYYSVHYLNLPKISVRSMDVYDLTKNTTYLQEVLDSFEKEVEIEKKLKELEETVLASLSSITTLKKLLEQWSEAKELLPLELLEAKVQLPALQTTNLNKLIGLPTKKEK